MFQGFEIQINGRKYFAFSMFKQSGKNITSYCNETLPGWAHDDSDRDWACYTAQKATAVPAKQHTVSYLDMEIRFVAIFVCLFLFA